jgi:hypothetical protein
MLGKSKPVPDINAGPLLERYGLKNSLEKISLLTT